MITLLLLVLFAAPGELITISGYAAVDGEVQSMAGVTLIEVSSVVPQTVYLCNPSRVSKGVRYDNPVAAGQRCRVLRPQSIRLDDLGVVDGVWTADGRLFADGEALYP